MLCKNVLFSAVMAAALCALSGRVQASEGCCSSMTEHTKDCVGECGACPISCAAKEAGADKAAILKVAKLRDVWIAAWNKTTASPEYKAAALGTKEAQKAKDEKALASAEGKLKQLLKPSAETFHAEAKKVLGDKVYAEFAKKLPDWARL